MLSNMGAVLSTLQADVLARSHYISRMIAASAVGLFDAALNYLWDELVSELRRRVVGFDLGYFYDTAAGGSDLRKNLKTEDDLTRIDDASMLRAAHEIGMLTDVGYQRLDHIRYMRNHASAGHPNQVTLTGLDHDRLTARECAKRSLPGTRQCWTSRVSWKSTVSVSGCPQRVLLTLHVSGTATMMPLKPTHRVPFGAVGREASSGAGGEAVSSSKVLVVRSPTTGVEPVPGSHSAPAPMTSAAMAATVAALSKR